MGATLKKTSLKLWLGLLGAILWPPSAALAKPFGLQVSPEEHHPNRKPIGVFTDGRATYSMGTYTTRLPISLPPARNGLVPELALEYRSDGRRTIYGDGWDVPIDHIRRSLRRGCFNTYGPHGDPGIEDEFEFQLGEHTGTLVYVGDEFGYWLYRPKIEGAFAKFYFHKNESYWTVQDRTGRTWFFGHLYLSSDQNCDAIGCITYAWYVQRIIDSFQNKIEYTYEQAHGNLYPTTIKYDLKENSTPGLSGGEFYLAASAADEFLARCRDELLAVVGIEVFTLMGERLKPDIDLIADFSGVLQTTGTWDAIVSMTLEEARTFLKRVPTGPDWWLNFVLLSEPEFRKAERA